jgi:biopolymer transport protein ExbD
MASTSAGEEKEELNFELNLLPVISMMSVCICFLLLTAVWTQIGSMNIDQGLGQESSRQDAKAASLWITMRSDGSMGLKMMDATDLPRDLQDRTFRASERGAWLGIEKHAAKIKKIMPTLKTALIMPDSRVNYGDVIRMMDRLKSLEIGEIGIAPL